MSPLSYPTSSRNKVKRYHERGCYNHETVHAGLDSGMLCHISYVIDGQPYCTPTSYWRVGTRVYWHGSSASRMLRSQKEGVPVCLTVAHLDGLVMARCGLNHSANYRSVMCFGQAKIVNDPEAKVEALHHFMERYFPGRTEALRQTTAQEYKATTVIMMDIEEASAKVRSGGVGDNEEDLSQQVWAGVIPITTLIGDFEPDPLTLAKSSKAVASPEGLKAYKTGKPLSEVLQTLAKH